MWSQTVNVVDISVPHSQTHTVFVVLVLLVFVVLVLVIVKVVLLLQGKPQFWLLITCSTLTISFYLAKPAFNFSFGNLSGCNYVLDLFNC